MILTTEECWGSYLWDGSEVFDPAGYIKAWFLESRQRSCLVNQLGPG